MWKDNLVAFEMETRLAQNCKHRDMRTIKMMIQGQTDPVIGTFWDMKTFSFANKSRIPRTLEELAEVWNGSTIVAHGLDAKYKDLAHGARAFGVEIMYPPARIDIHMADFGLRPGKRMRRLENICRRWGVSSEIGGLADRVHAIGQVAMAMLPRLPDDEVELDAVMCKWRDEYMKMRNGFRRTA